MISLSNDWETCAVILSIMYYTKYLKPADIPMFSTFEPVDQVINY